MEYKDGALCIVIKDNKVLMVKTERPTQHAYYTLPGGGIESGETPEQAAIRELQEECGVFGKIICKLSENRFAFGDTVKIHCFLIEIGNQEPVLGCDPEKEHQVLTEVRWMALDEMSERDRAFLWAAGLAGIKQFFNELTSWDNDISYPSRR